MNVIEYNAAARPQIAEWFIKELEKIGGYDEFSDPQLRLVWAPDRIDHNGWPVYMNQSRKRHGEHQRESGIWYVEDYIEVSSIERWVIEEKWHPALFRDGYEQSRWERDPETGKLIDLLGPLPETGKYRSLLVLETDEGEYVEPNELVLEFLRVGIKYRNERFSHAKDEAPKPHELKNAVRERLHRAEVARQAWKSRFKDELRSSLLPHKHRLTSFDPNAGSQSRLRRGHKYNPNHWPFPHKEPNARI